MLLNISMFLFYRIFPDNTFHFKFYSTMSLFSVAFFHIVMSHFSLPYSPCFSKASSLNNCYQIAGEATTLTLF